jgi:hypothetical protein
LAGYLPERISETVDIAVELRRVAKLRGPVGYGAMVVVVVVKTSGG